MQEHWPHILKNLEKTLENGVIKVWLEPLHAEGEGGHIRLYAPSAFAAQWVRSHWGEALLAATRAVLQREDVTLEFLVKAPSPECAARDQARSLFAPGGLPTCPATDGAVTTPANGVADGAGATPPVAQPLPLALPPLPRWRHDFSDFVVGASNSVAFAAAQDLCRAHPAIETLFVSSASGLGKTHLAQAVGQRLQHDKARVGYLTAEEFTSRFVLASRTRQMDAFKASLRNLDVFLLEDIHFFQGKEKTQEEVLATLKALLNRGCRVVLTSTFTPCELRHMDSQLVSHCSAGMLAIMQRPDHAMRCEILRRKARVHQVLLPDAVTEAIASRITSDVRQLESCLMSLLFKAHHLKMAVCLDMALEVLAQYAQGPAPVSLQRLVELVCQVYGLSREQLLSRSRKSEFVQARNTAFYLARKHTGLSLQEIGGTFNRRHSTVINGITNLEQEVKRQSPLGRQLAKTISLIEANAGIRA